jgi:hypothetical protein
VHANSIFGRKTRTHTRTHLHTPTHTYTQTRSTMDTHLAPNNPNHPDLGHQVISWLRVAKTMPPKLLGDPGQQVRITAEHWHLFIIAEALGNEDSEYDGNMSVQAAEAYIAEAKQYANPCNSPLATQVRAMCTAYDALDQAQRADVASYVYDDQDEHDEHDEHDGEQFEMAVQMDLVE